MSRVRQRLCCCIDFWPRSAPCCTPGCAGKLACKTLAGKQIVAELMSTALHVFPTNDREQGQEVQVIYCSVCLTLTKQWTYACCVIQRGPFDSVVNWAPLPSGPWGTAAAALSEVMPLLFELIALRSKAWASRMSLTLIRDGVPITTR